MKEVKIYTDGSCRGNPGPGGWGAVMLYNKHCRELCGGERHTTNNRMEIMAAIKSLNALKEPCQVTIYTDSNYLKQAMTLWMSSWKRRNWRLASGEKVKNVDLWKELNEESSRHRVKWKWIKAHAGDPMNERADSLAKRGSGA